MRSEQPGTSGLRRLLLLSTAAALAASATGCGDSSSDSSQSSGAAKFPVTISSCGQDVTFDQPPKRAVTTDVNMTEMMLALGLGDPLMVGTFGVGEGKEIGAQYQEAWDHVAHVSVKYPDLEPLVALEPDFLFTGWSWGLDESKNIVPDNLASHGIKTYALGESCDYAPGGTTKTAFTMETTYNDLRNLGQIFDVSPKAEKIVSDMEAQIADVQERIKGTSPTKVFVYDSGEATPVSAHGLAAPQALITLGGGTNIFADVQTSWDYNSWENVVARQPDCIILNEYGGSDASTTAAWKEDFLKSSPLTKDLPAVKNNCFLTLTMGQLASGPRNADTIEAIARWLHPEVFD
jgi:iron complex transport system substrate-binding protein